ncbi:MAG: hypothetical protein GXY67_03955 [Clostridiales bacterium]|nr:hypothetical protein [Clostridiales bacterium]
MQKPLAPITQVRVNRSVLALLLTLGILLPLLMLFDLGHHVALGLVYGIVALAIQTLATFKKHRWIAILLAGAWGIVQFFLPRTGFWGGSIEALKALTLYFNKLPVAMPIFGGQVAALLGVSVAVCSFLFVKKGVGFLPATMMVVLTLFALWSLGRGGLVWFTLPALVVLLLLISQNAHEKMSIMNVLPMAIAVVLASLLLLPSGRVTIPPLEKAAFQLKQTISDYLFFTEPRNVFTLGSYGYYPMGASQLGGEAEPSNYPVMLVKTESKTLLRAVIKDDYTGRSFRDTSSPRRYLYVNPRWAALRASVFLENLPPEAIRKASPLLDEKAISVQMQNTAASTVFTPVFLRSQSMQGSMVPYFNDASELFITRDLAQGDKYTVYAPIFEGGDGGLDALVNAVIKNDKNYQDILARYTKLPSHMEQRVFQDVAAMTANAQTPYDKAMAIMRHLQKYYRYTLSPKTPPENNDFVTYFLYIGKEGYCTYYAAAMTVMCRMAGLPARYVEGFLAQPATDGLAYVTGENAHAWTEVYFEGFGWVPFDPTPLRQGENQEPPPQDPPPQDEPPETEPTPSPAPDDPQEPPTPPPPEQQEQPQQEDNDPNEDLPDPPNPFPWWLLVAIAAMGALIWRVTSRMPKRVAAKAASEQDRIFVYGNAVFTILRLKGRRPKPGETPLLFAKRIDSVHVLPEPILPLWRAMALSNYSRRMPGKEQTQRALAIFTGIYKKQKPFTKLRFYFTAAFDKTCYTSLDTVLIHEIILPKTRLPSTDRNEGNARKRKRAGRSIDKDKAKPTGNRLRSEKPRRPQSEKKKS